MKKRANINFILATILAVALLIIPAVLGIIAKEIDEEAQVLQNKMEMVLVDGDAGDLENYGTMAEEMGSGIGNYAKMLFIVSVVLVGGYALLMFLFALIARLVLKKDGQNLTAYRVLMGVEYLLQAGILWVIIDILLDIFNVIVLCIGIVVLVVLIYSAINTYTKRICE